MMGKYLRWASIAAVAFAAGLCLVPLLEAVHVYKESDTAMLLIENSNGRYRLSLATDEASAWESPLLETESVYHPPSLTYETRAGAEGVAENSLGKTAYAVRFRFIPIGKEVKISKSMAYGEYVRWLVKRQLKGYR